jgi:hypothetical protein
MSNKLNFDYNNIRKLTSNLKTNLREKYSSLENITSNINNTADGIGYQYSSLQTSETDKYIDELSLLFENNTLDGNYKVNGNLSVKTLSVDNIIVNDDNLNVGRDKYDINKIIESIKLQDLKLSKQTINDSKLNNIIVNNSYIYGSIINDSILNRPTLNNIRSINGLIGINNSNPLYTLDVNGSCRLGTNSSSITHIEYGNVTLNVGGTYIVNTKPFGLNVKIMLSYINLGSVPTNILYTSSVSSPSFTIVGDANAEVSWILIE